MLTSVDCGVLTITIAPIQVTPTKHVVYMYSLYTEYHWADLYSIDTVVGTHYREAIHTPYFRLSETYDVRPALRLL